MTGVFDPDPPSDMLRLSQSCARALGAIRAAIDSTGILFGLLRNAVASGPACSFALKRRAHKADGSRDAQERIVVARDFGGSSVADKPTIRARIAMPLYRLREKRVPGYPRDNRRVREASPRRFTAVLIVVDQDSACIEQAFSVAKQLREAAKPDRIRPRRSWKGGLYYSARTPRYLTLVYDPQP